MMQVTCGACGATQELADADAAAAAGKSVTCATCKSRIPVPASSAVRGAALPDLPAPRRPSPLAAAGPARPAPRSPLAGAVDLPAPKAPPKIPDIPRAAIPDLPAPKAPPLPKVSSTAPTVPDVAAAQRAAEASDLPAPKRPPPPMFASGPAPDAPSDLVAPKRGPLPRAAAPPLPQQTTSGIAPPRPPARPAAPAAGGMDLDLDDLLAPTARPGAPPELPGPIRSDADLVAPKRPGGPAAPPVPVELPAPKPAPRDLGDLPAPKPNAAGSTDLPAPKGFFDDLPQPARQQPGSTDLPAPKGFFDDLPQPARARGADLPAPKGFFDDIPQPARNQSGLPTPAAQQTGLPTPAANQTGLPQPVSAAAAAPVGGRAHAPSAPPPTADDLFDDLTPPPAMQVPPALDLDDLDLGPPGVDAAPVVDGTRPRSPSTSGLRRTAPPPSTPPPSGTRATNDTDAEAVPLLDLGDADKPDFGKLDLPSTRPLDGAAPGASGVSFRAQRGTKPGTNHEPVALAAGGGDLALDVDEPKAAPRRKRRTSQKSPKTRARSTPTSRRGLLIAVLVLAVLGGGGYLGYRWWTQHQAAAQRAAEIKQKLASARAALVAGDPAHWRRALADAAAAFDASGKDADAAGIAAQAAFASTFDDGAAGAEQRQKQGAAILVRALGVPLSGGELDRAQALKLVLDGQPAKALERYLDPAAKRAPTDANLALYQGWARLAAGDPTGAIEAFERSAKALPKRDVPAVYGRAQAKLALGDRAGAREDFTLVLGKDKAHVGAQVGLAATAITPAEVAQREKDLVALLATKDIDKSDPRLVAAAYTIIGDDARDGGRLDAARDRYRKAAGKAPLAAGPLRGQAELALREGKLDDAAAAIDKAQKLAPDDVEVNLVAGELALARGAPADAEVRITKLRDRKPVNPWHKARLFVLTGRWHAALGRVEDALAAFEDAVTVANPADLDTPLAVAAQLGAMAEADPARAVELRAHAQKLLAPIEAQAGATPSIAIALGVGYMAAGDPARAEVWLRKAVASAKYSDEIDARFQLAEALARQHKTDEALAMLQTAFDRDDNRLDVGLQLALRYEEAGRAADATAMYEKMLPKPTVTLDLRGRAGRFYARQGQADKARQQGEEILKVDSNHPTGLFLRGVGLLAEGKLEDARRALQAATDADKVPQFLEAFGRVNEALGKKSGDMRYKDEALRAYTAAVDGDPQLLAALAGKGRLLIERREAGKALEALLAAQKLAPDDADLMYSIGYAHQLAGDGKEAVEWMSRSLAKKPRPDGYYNVGNIHYEAGQLAPAAVALARATELGAQAERGGATLDWLTNAYYMLGEAEHELRHEPAARKAWQTFIDRNPTDVVKVDKVKRAMLGMRR